MKIYFVRHGKDDGQYRGGWSSMDLSEEGKEQARLLAVYLKKNNSRFNITKIIASDLPRAVSTASICADSLKLEVQKEPMLREMNNGDLAGMLNNDALVKYPGIYFSSLRMDEQYPNGESPQEFYNRIKYWFEEFVKAHRDKETNYLVVTHSGVINIIYHLANGLTWTNKNKSFKVANCSIHVLNLSNMEFEHKFYALLEMENLPIWEACLNTSFLRDMEKGTLGEKRFRDYIIQDSLYLREYAKVFAAGIMNATTMEEVRMCYSLLSFVNKEEDRTRLSYLARYGLNDEQIQTVKQYPDNQAYTDFMTQSALHGGMPEVMMACLPCMTSYLYIFRKMTGRTHSVLDGLYGKMVYDYITDEYREICDYWIDYTEKICSTLTPDRLEICREIFLKSSKWELKFWEMFSD